MSVCPSCKNEFLQPFVCATCGAEKLYDATLRQAQAELASLRARQAVLVEALTPAFKAIDAISADPNDMQRRRDAEVNCFYAVQRARAALAKHGKGNG